ncbi:flagellar biosynthesis protein [Pseudoflavonifractor sp. 524-17]|uniref:TIGR02530 family flagellar biosynthesis protein n=1 Tax=Pseudoflavonifractor sp. 524-17 TaxID=2304577 RepID=UPI00137B855D|nr:TIGR02530 family flagellar biosynthesis protein [Pseudoflavonifractor sp. 524-17]NCE66046.1 flagellar biosynthesis protein [Pseudoflavonifractor sp. 524-17]
MIQRVTGAGLGPAPQVHSPQKGQGGGFGALLQQELARSAQQQPAQSVAFSKHAISRAEERGIEVTPALMDQLAGSVVRAQAKGATNILAMDAEKAFIINVPSAKVITAITQDEMKENVFTNIDGAVFL